METISESGGDCAGAPVESGATTREQGPKQQSDAMGSDVQFLLAEYDRLRGMEIGQWEAYNTRFNSFMTVSLGVLAAYVALVTASQSPIPSGFPFPDLLAAVVLAWGGMTFLGLTETSYGIKHLVNALRSIQAYFTKRHPELSGYLYFDKPELYNTPSKVEYVAGRWILSGSPKAVLALINAGLSAILTARLLTELAVPTFLVVVASGGALLIVGLLHPLYVRFAYRRTYLAP